MSKANRQRRWQICLANSRKGRTLAFAPGFIFVSLWVNKCSFFLFAQQFTGGTKLNTPVNCSSNGYGNQLEKGTLALTQVCKHSWNKMTSDSIPLVPFVQRNGT